MLLTVLSAKGAPGTTTTAAALAAVGAEQRGKAGRPQPIDLVELDPSGGDVEPLTGITGEAGLLRAASELRATARIHDVLAHHVVEAPRGVRSLLAPTSGFEAFSTVSAVGAEEWGETLSTLPGLIVVDAGRWEAQHPLAHRILGSEIAVIVCRPDARGVEHVRHIVTALRSVVPKVALVTVGSRPYGVDEIAAYLGVFAAGAMAWDPGGAAALWADGLGKRRWRGWGSSWLARSARAVLAKLWVPSSNDTARVR